MNNRAVKRVVIAGAGIAGLAAGLAFRKSGHEVILVERTSSLDAAVGAGILIQANGLLVLDALGLGEAVRAAGVSLQSFDLRDRRGGLLLRTEVGQVLPPSLCPVSIHRAELHRILWEACVSSGVLFRLGYTVRGVETQALSPSLIGETAAGEERITGDLVVGADGVKSVVRETGGFKAHLEEVIEGSVQGVAPLPMPDECHGEYFGGGEACGLLPIGGQHTFWFWGGSGKVVQDIEDAPFSHWKERVGRNFPAMRQVLGRYDDWSGLVRLLHRSVRCEQWSIGNVVLIGDAAHAMSPNLGQGANCALVDALALACHMVESPAAHDFSEALGRFERGRRSLVDAIQRQGHEDGLAGTQDCPGAELLFSLALRLARFTSSARRQAEIRMMSGLDGDGFDLAAAGVPLPMPW